MAAYRPGAAETLATAQERLSQQDAKGALAAIDTLAESEPDGLPEEKGEQETALRQVDLAIAELAHLGSDLATTLLAHRDQFVRGEWRSLGLV